MKNELNKLSAIGLPIGVVFGNAGGVFSNPIQQRIVYQISSLGLSAVLVLLTVNYLRSEKASIPGTAV